ncbi:MAG: type II secretion system F family protein [Patescibacteria group bacterium]
MQKFKKIELKKFDGVKLGGISKIFKKLHIKAIRFSFFKLSIKDQMFFAKRLSFLIKAGVPLLESLYMIKDQTISRKFQKIILPIIDDVSNGQFLSTSLGKFRHLFGDLVINIISIGEQGGVLSSNLEYLAEELKKREALRRKVVSAFVYPIVVIVATLSITTFLMVYLFPKIIPIFASLGAGLPTSTRMLIWMSNFLQNHGFLLLISIIIFSILISIILRKNKVAHFFMDYFFIKVPIIGSVVRYYNVANSTRTLGLLLRSGLTLNEALPITGKTTKNLVYQREFNHLSKVVNRGERISSHLKKNRSVFPDMVHQIVAVGERSGNLAGSLVYVSELYENEVDDFTKNLSSLIEPVLMIFMGVLVGFVAISIISPIYSITQHLSPK